MSKSRFADIPDLLLLWVTTYDTRLTKQNNDFKKRSLQFIHSIIFFNTPSLVLSQVGPVPVKVKMTRVLIEINEYPRLQN